MAHSHPKLVLYDFAGSVWVKAPRIAITECGFKDGDVEFRSVDLANGANFDPNGFLKVSAKGTVPVLLVGDHKYDSSSTAVEQIIKYGPDSPKKDTHTDHETRKLIHAVHSPQHDPNTMFVLPVDDKDLEAKASGVQGGFVAGRQKALDKYAPSASSEFKEFLEKKQKENGEVVKLFQDSDAQYRAPFYSNATEQWKSAGEFIRGDLTHILRKTPGKFLGGADRPGEADFHLITWLARTITNAGIKPGSLSEVVLPALASKTGGQDIDPVVGGYWDAWTVRPSFKDNNVH